MNNPHRIRCPRSNRLRLHDAGREANHLQDTEGWLNGAAERAQRAALSRCTRSTVWSRIAAWCCGGDGPAVAPGVFSCPAPPITARTLQGMARVRSGQASAWPLVNDRRGAEAPRSRVTESHFRRKCEAPLTVEGHPRTLSGPSPDPRLCTFRSPLAPSASDQRPAASG